VAYRWWRGERPEWDLVSEALEERRILLGEAKWSSRPMSRASIERACRLVASKPAPELPSKYAGHDEIRCLMVPEVTKGVPRMHAGVWIVRGTELIG
jgi:hypothetical protein